MRLARSFIPSIQKYEYYCDHTYRPDADSVVWTLDYDKTSDFDDIAGHWHLEDHPSKKVRGWDGDGDDIYIYIDIYDDDELLFLALGRGGGAGSGD